MTKRKPYKRYSAEFKKEAIRRAAEEGMTDKTVCDELGISTRQFRRWRDELELLGRDAFPGQGHSRDEEMTALKRESSQPSSSHKAFDLEADGKERSERLTNTLPEETN